MRDAVFAFLIQFHLSEIRDCLLQKSLYEMSNDDKGRPQRS